jgi:hypothetical protein
MMGFDGVARRKGGGHIDFAIVHSNLLTVLATGLPLGWSRCAWVGFRDVMMYPMVHLWIIYHYLPIKDGDLPQLC